MTKGYDGVKRWTKQVRSGMQVVQSFISVCDVDGRGRKLAGDTKRTSVFLAQVDLFSKSLILVPIHLEVHWCLVTADNVGKKICIYDSQGNALQKVARVTAHFNEWIHIFCHIFQLSVLKAVFFFCVLRSSQNILKYLMTEAKEKKQTAFENGWAVSFDEVGPTYGPTSWLASVRPLEKVGSLLGLLCSWPFHKTHDQSNHHLSASKSTITNSSCVSINIYRKFKLNFLTIEKGKYAFYFLNFASIH